MENKLTVVLTTLISMVDEECQILQHSSQCIERIDLSILAMHTTILDTMKE
jgi:hypothetical protein